MSAGTKQQQQPSEEFLAWYGEFCLDENQEKVSNRYSACANIAKTLQSKDIATFLDLLFSSKKSTQALTEIKTKIQKHDSLFALHGSDREASVLAGIALSMLLKSDKETALIAAMSLLTASFEQGRQLIKLPMELLDIANDALFRISINRRKRVALKMPNSADLEPLKEIQKSLPEPSKTGEERADSEEPDPLEASVARSIVDNAVYLADKTQKFCGELVRRLEVQDEELDMLWWLYSERSDLTNQFFVDIPELERPILLANELVEKTKLAPGPTSIKSMLLKAGVTDTKKTLDKFIEAARTELIDNCAVDNPPALIFPIHTALSLRKEFNYGKTWKDSWLAKSEIGKSHNVSGLSIARLFYFEKLLLRVFE